MFTRIRSHFSKDSREARHVRREAEFARDRAGYTHTHDTSRFDPLYSRYF